MSQVIDVVSVPNSGRTLFLTMLNQGTTSTFVGYDLSSYIPTGRKVILLYDETNILTFTPLLSLASLLMRLRIPVVMFGTRDDIYSGPLAIAPVKIVDALRIVLFLGSSLTGKNISEVRQYILSL